MLDQTTLLQKEIYTERLNDMYARISEFQAKAPRNLYKNDLKKMSEEIAIAHRTSRFYSDMQHFARWEELLTNADLLLRKAGGCL